GDIQTEAANLLDRVGVTGDDLEQAVGRLDFGAVAGQISSALSSLLSLTSAIGLLVITLLFMVIDAARFDLNLAEVGQERPEVAKGLQQFARQTRHYFVISTVFGLIVAAVDVVALMILGVPLALVWGLLSLITNYIPNIGFVIGLVPPALLGYFEGGWRLALWVIASYAAINFIIQSVIQPKFVGDALGLSATLTFLSLIFWGWVLGPLGALLAVPMTLLAKALLIDIDPSTRWAGPLIALPPVAGVASGSLPPDFGDRGAELVEDTESADDRARPDDDPSDGSTGDDDAGDGSMAEPETATGAESAEVTEPG
ncbi:MAG: AI-2E family transporter, partial [Actinomycetota bacterium]